MNETIERAGAETRPYEGETAGGKPPAHTGNPPAHIGGEQAMTRTPEMVGAEIRSLSYEAKCVTVWYAVQIGKRLTEAKSMVKHGEWLDWLSRETEYSQPTASRLMRIYAEYGADQGSLFGAETKYSTLNNLSVSNALRLLAVPEEERESFAAEVDAEHLSAKELEQAIRERDEARKALQTTEARLEDTQRTLADSDKQITDLRQRLVDAQEDIRTADEQAEENERQLKARIKELESRPVEVAVQEPDPEAVNKAVREAVAEAARNHESELAALQKKLEAAKKAEEKAKAAQKKAEEEKADAEKTASEKAEGAAKAAGAETAALQAEVERLKKELQLTDAAVTTFRERFSTWQASYNSMIEALGGVEGETAGKLRGAVRAMLTRWEEALGDG